MPIFVLTHNVPKKHPKENEQLKVNFVIDGVESAIQKAKAAAGHRNIVVIGGESNAQQCIKARVVDKLQVDVMPFLLCEMAG